jgi:hypothetical protein
LRNRYDVFHTIVSENTPFKGASDVGVKWADCNGYGHLWKSLSRLGLPT